MGKIVFVNLHEDIKRGNISLGILSLATVLKEKNYDVQVVDYNTFIEKKILTKGYTIKFEDLEYISDYILSLNIDLVSFYTMCNYYHKVIYLSKILNEKNKDLKILLGGPHASLTAKLTLKAFSWIDAVGIGEGEENIDCIIDVLIGNRKDFREVDGLILRKNNEIIFNKEIPLLRNLDKLPLIDYSFVNLDKNSFLPLDVGRGCPYGCTYCSTKTFWKRNFRLKSTGRIIYEIKYLIDNYNVRAFDFIHDLFTANRDSVIELCKSIKNEKLNIKWTCSARIDTLNEEVIREMNEAGCTSIYLGIETGSIRMQQIINKNLNIAKVYEIISILKKYNFRVTVSFIYGFPEESFEDIECTVELIKFLSRERIYSIQYHALSILPGTEIYNKLVGKLIFSRNNSDISQNDKIENEYVELIENHPEIFSHFYEYTTPLTEKMKYMDKFISMVFPTMYKYLNCTYELLLNHYNENLIDLFLDFKSLNGNILEDIENNEMIFMNNKRYKEVKQMLSAFVEYVAYKKADKKIKEVYRFEMTVFEFLYDEDCKEKVETYSCDVYRMKKENSIEIFDMQVSVMFRRIDKKKINIKKII